MILSKITHQFRNVYYRCLPKVADNLGEYYYIPCATLKNVSVSSIWFLEKKGGFKKLFHIYIWLLKVNDMMHIT